MWSLDLWSLQHEAADANENRIARKQLGFKDALQWLRHPQPPATDSSSTWKVDVLTAHVGKLADYIVPITRLVSALGFEQEDVGTVGDTVAFNSYVVGGVDDNLLANSRLYCLSDNMFGVYWAWNPAARCTKAFMYGMTGEGTRQMQHVWKRIATTPARGMSSPIIVGTATLEAEAVEMRRWVASQGDELVSLHIDTGHHSYARTRYGPVDSSKLAAMSRNVCGLAINISSSVLCLNRILKFADYLSEEWDGFENATQHTPSADDSKAMEDLIRSQDLVKAQIKIWRRRADALLDESKSWQHKASILVQTVFTLTTQRDTAVSIAVAQDSRTLAQKATRDSNSMKAIAAVTMCFLPGTFVASLFDLSMFDWSPAPGQRLSGDFWIYWAVTLPLTIVVLALWLSWTNRKDLRERVRRSTANMKSEGEEEASGV